MFRETLAPQGPDGIELSYQLRSRRRGSNQKKDPHGELACRAGPVTGSAGSGRRCGRSDVTIPIKSEGLLVLIPPGAPQPFSLKGEDGLVQVIPVGAAAALVEVENADAAAALAAAARAHGIAADEIVPAARTVLFDGVDIEDLASAMDSLLQHHPQGSEPPLVTLPVRYDGPDVEWVARHWDCSLDDVVARHSGLEFRVVFCGFAPGFAYLSGLPADWAVPRLDSPRSLVPAGSVGLADDLCGVYPTASPGGWRLLGTTTARLWDLDAERPALLAPGTRVRFEPSG